MSADLQWQLLRTHTSFLVKRDGATFTSEPNNLAAKHTFKFSGLVNSQAVGISQEDGAVVVTTKRSKNASKPVSSLAKKSIKTHKKNKQSSGAKAVTTMTSGSYYRSDLTQYAVARYNALQKALKVDGSLAKNRNKVISRRSRKSE